MLNFNSKSIVRLAVTQAIYKSILLDELPSIEELIWYYDNPINLTTDLAITEKVNLYLNIVQFKDFISCFQKNRSDIAIVLKTIDFSKEQKIHPMMLSIIQCGICELLYLGQTTPKITLSEFTKIASTFLSLKEVGFVNFVLDKIYQLNLNQNNINPINEDTEKEPKHIL